MNELERIAQLLREGYTRTYVGQDPANKSYPDHTNSFATANIILNGEITITMYGQPHLYHAGDRFDVPANTPHSVVIGPNGSRYLVGER